MATKSSPMMPVFVLQMMLVAAMVASCAEATSNHETSELAARPPLLVRRQLANKIKGGRGQGLPTVPPCLGLCSLLGNLSTCCSGLCVDLSNNIFNCGKCSTTCSPGQFCCSGTCTSVMSDPNNCGMCGKKCPKPDVCSFGLCSYNGLPTFS